MCECCIQPPAQLSSTCSARGGELGGVPRLISSSKKEPGNETGWGASSCSMVGRSGNEANITEYS